MSNSPFFSIVTPLYNREDLIEETIKSLINQSYISWEYLIVDDGSTDDSLKRVNQWAKTDNRIKSIPRNRLPKGAPTCRNIGLNQALGKYIVFLDSDDLLKTNCLEQRAHILTKHLDIDFIATGAELFRLEPGDKEIKLNILNKERDDISRFLTLDFPWQTAGCTYNIETLKAYNISWDEDLACHQDLDFSMQILSSGLQYKKIEEVIDLDLRMGGTDKISKHGKTKKHIESKILYLKNILENNKIDNLKYKTEIYFLALFILNTIYKVGLTQKEEEVIDLLKKNDIIKSSKLDCFIYYDTFITFKVFPRLQSEAYSKYFILKTIRSLVEKTTSAVNFFKIRTLGKIVIKS